jgi:hypothetical protein
MATDYDVIREALKLLQRRRPNVFGAEAHGFKVNPPLTAEAVRQFEAEHRVALPEDYLGFLMHVGDGGAGPYYGLFKLGEMDEGCWEENGDFVGVLAEPFPHATAWNDLTGEPECDEERLETDQAYEEEYSEKLTAWEEAHYWNPKHVNGAIPICHLGCALRHWLVITGPERGHVWSNERVDHAGLKPLRGKAGAPERVTFMRWYRDWLDDAMQGM